MKLIRAACLGFCFGVRRAVELAEKELAVGGTVCTIGPLIHNPQVLAALQEKGLTILDSENLPLAQDNRTVIIRAHGISPVQEERLYRRGWRMVDATCPRVKAIQMKARSLTEQGYLIFLAGEQQHAEIIGIQGYAPHCMVVANADQAEAAARRVHKIYGGQYRAALLAQSTFSADEYEAVEKAIKTFFPDLEVVCTICGATAERQDALRELCGVADAVIIAGGRGSANTQRLLSIAVNEGKPAWLVENAEEAAALKDRLAPYRTVGLCAGASTPDDLIDEIEIALCAVVVG